MSVRHGKAPRRPIKGLHINRMIPVGLTLMALAFGLSSIRFALQERWEHAVLAVVVAAVLDGLDGRIARFLKGASRFGAELDSLSDFLSFGVAPALILYLWSLSDAGRLGWSLVLLLCICCALRLARFNTALDEPATPPWSQRFFTGVPSPAGAGITLLPMLAWFQLESEWLRQPAVVGVFMIATSGLLVSRVHTFSLKTNRIPPERLLPVMLGGALYLALLISLPWIVLSLSVVAYIVSIPIGERTYQRLQSTSAESDPS